jgi:hypothetical protein
MQDKACVKDPSYMLLTIKAKFQQRILFRGSVMENSEAGHTILRLVARDSDLDRTILYSLQVL